jgi:hypothetical protein
MKQTFYFYIFPEGLQISRWLNLMLGNTLTGNSYYAFRKTPTSTFAGMCNPMQTVSILIVMPLSGYQEKIRCQKHLVASFGRQIVG